jgi:hypothetical protein
VNGLLQSCRDQQIHMSTIHCLAEKMIGHVQKNVCLLGQVKILARNQRIILKVCPSLLEGVKSMTPSQNPVPGLDHHQNCVRLNSFLYSQFCFIYKSVLIRMFLGAK